MYSSTDIGDTFAQNKTEFLYIREKTFFKLFSSTSVDPCLKTEPQKHFSVQLKWSVGIRYLGFAALQLIASLFFGFTTCSCSDVSQAACCASSSDLLSLREDPEITRGFIYLFIQPFFHTVALFPKLTNVLELIEYDPLTAV